VGKKAASLQLIFRAKVIRIYPRLQFDISLERAIFLKTKFKLASLRFMPKKILFLVPYPVGASPSQRFRFEHFFPILQEQGFYFKIQSFLDSQNWQIFFKPGKPFSKLWALLLGFGRRWAAVAQAPFYDFIFIHREAAPIGPPVVEWLLAKVLRRKIIYDFDDAIWLTDRRTEPVLFRWVKWRSKVAAICRWSFKVSCGNRYLMDFASQFNTRVFYAPTVVDTANWHNPALYDHAAKKADEIVIGWTGTHSTLKYLGDLVPVLQKIETQFPQVRILVIADRKPDFELRSLLFIPWSKATEVKDLMNMDIGIMPLPDDEWAKGKCGFKALQYMALGIPTVVSPVGVNTEIVNHGQDGFVADTPEKWYDTLAELATGAELRKQTGAQSRKKIEDRYSVISSSASFVSLFES
jgi:glycosyltransferase involved in cell wall biosynthesis